MDNLRDFVVEDDILLDYIGDKERVVIPEGIREIGINAFWNNKNVKHVVFPETLEKIGSGAFAGVDLQELHLPGNLKIIEYHAFDGCRGLEEVRLPASLHMLSYAAFSMCENLRTIAIAEGNQKYFSQDGMVCSRYPGKGKLIYLHTCPPGMAGDVVLTGHFDVILGNAFGDCRKITSAKLSEGLRDIQELAFYGCKCLERVEMPQSLKRVGREVFAECSNLQSVVLPDALEAIGSIPFDGCKKLEEIFVSDEALVRYVDELDLLEAVYLTPAYEGLADRWAVLEAQNRERGKAGSVEDIIEGAGQRCEPGKGGDGFVGNEKDFF